MLFAGERILQSSNFGFMRSNFAGIFGDSRRNAGAGIMKPRVESLVPMPSSSATLLARLPSTCTRSTALILNSLG